MGVESKVVELKKDKVGFEEKEKKLVRKGRQNMKRSNMLAKQVISIQSAVSLGFITQLWVNTDSVSDLGFVIRWLLH